MHGTSFLAALGAGILVACASANSGITPSLPAPHDSGNVELSPPAVDLSGTWATGSGSEPPDGPVVERPSCAYNPATWILQQTRNTLKAWAIPETFNQGV